MSQTAFIGMTQSLRIQCLHRPHNILSSCQRPITPQKSISPHHHHRLTTHQAATAPSQDETPTDITTSKPQRSTLSSRARQRQSDKEFFTDLLTSASTKRDAKTYINWLKESEQTGTQPEKSREGQHPNRTSSRTPLGGRPRAADQSPTFKQYADIKESHLYTGQTIHLALVKIRDISLMGDEVLQGIARTLSQLSRLSVAPCVIVEEVDHHEFPIWRKHVNEQVERLIRAIEDVGEARARKLDNLLSYSAEGRPQILSTNLFFRALSHDRIPIIPPIAYDEAKHKAIRVSADASIVAMVKQFATPPSPAQGSEHSRVDATTLPISLERIIVIDNAGGIPSTKSADKVHLFVNLAQEYSPLQEELRSSSSKRVSARHASNLRLMRDTLRYLPQTSSGLITTPMDAANMNRMNDKESISSVGTRRQKNPLIHNLLTDKPIYSSSLPTGRLTNEQGASAESASTFVKLGMPLTILPEPVAQPWRADSKPRLKLTDSRIDLGRLVYLINDSFGRKLDVDAYLKRVNDRIAGVIIAGDYEGGAILTWETPPGVEDNDTSRLVPYLDKFAVLKKAQGAGGVADIVFNAMVRTCFPHGVCWRSRKDNPVNKWYFERSRGTWKISEMNWTMFWTTPNLSLPGFETTASTSPGDSDRQVVSSAQLFMDYEGVCRNVQPTWADMKQVLD